MNLTDKTLVLTGASGGIGSAIAHAFAAQGCRLILAGRQRDKLAALQQALPGQQRNHQVICCDLGTAAGRQAWLDGCRGQGVSLLVKAAGVLDFRLVERQGSADVERILTTNLLAPMLLCQSFIPLLKQSGEAAIVNIGSIYGSIGHPGFATYCASKSGLKGFSEALRRELADTGIKVYYLAPRATATAFNPDRVTALNQELGNSIDTTETVAKELLRLIRQNRPQSFMGWPEKLFVYVNALFPGIVHNALVKKLPVVKRHADTD